MTPEKFSWDSREGEKRIQEQVERRQRHDKWAAQQLDGDVDEKNFDQHSLLMPDVYDLERVSDEASEPAATQSPELPIRMVNEVISRDPYSGRAPYIIVNSLNHSN
ncbi:MAG: hypothetical protein WC553_01095 [Patescibacteria group bacterium]|jgi:hypothetical protein